MNDVRSFRKDVWEITFECASSRRNPDSFIVMCYYFLTLLHYKIVPFLDWPCFPDIHAPGSWSQVSLLDQKRTAKMSISI